MGTQIAFDFDGSTYNPAVISSQILTHLASSAESLFGFVPDDVVITVPASFDSDMREATIEAAKLAGFRTQEDDGSPRDILLDEPVLRFMTSLTDKTRARFQRHALVSMNPRLF